MSNQKNHKTVTNHLNEEELKHIAASETEGRYPHLYHCDICKMQLQVYKVILSEKKRKTQWQESQLFARQVVGKIENELNPRPLPLTFFLLTFTVLISFIFLGLSFFKGPALAEMAGVDQSVIMIRELQYIALTLGSVLLILAIAKKVAAKNSG